jgi:hypothetical protein
MLQKNLAGDRCPDAQRKPCIFIPASGVPAQLITYPSLVELACQPSQNEDRVTAPVEDMCNYDSKGRETMSFLSFTMIRASTYRYCQAPALCYSLEITSRITLIDLVLFKIHQLGDSFSVSFYSAFVEYEPPLRPLQWSIHLVEAQRQQIRAWIVTATTLTT